MPIEAGLLTAQEAPPARLEQSRPRLVTTAETRDIRIIGVEDMPAYSNLDVEIVDRSIEALPVEKMWFTYAAVQACFGVSRATVARRMKDGLIPGIRFHGSNVLEDGPVRRFSRAQIRWLLLAIRTTRGEHAERAIRNLRLPARR